MAWFKYFKLDQSISSATPNYSYSYPYCKRAISKFTPRDTLSADFWLFANIKDLNINTYKSSTLETLEDANSYVVVYEKGITFNPVKTVINGDYIYFETAEEHTAVNEIQGSYFVYYATPNLRKLNEVDNAGTNDYQVNLSPPNPYCGLYSEVSTDQYEVNLNSDSSYNFSFINSMTDWDNGLSNKPGSKLYINFSGPKFTLYGSKGINYGKFRIKFTALQNAETPAVLALDWQTIDCFSSSFSDNIELFSKLDFEEKDHVAELEVLYEKNIGSRGNNIKISKYSFSYNLYLKVGTELINQIDNSFTKIGGLR